MSFGPLLQRFCDCSIEELNNCPRCRGEGIFNDLNFDNLGRAILTDKENKLAGDLTKIIVTLLGENPFSPDYGSGLRQFISAKINRDVILNQLKQTVGEAIERLKTLQILQGRGQTLDPEESIQSIEDVQVFFDEVDPTKLHVRATLLTEAVTTVQVFTTLVA